jgi:hypothetical protein
MLHFKTVFKCKSSVNLVEAWHYARRRLLPEHFLGLKQGEAEVIRNGGGRVTEDVIR